MSWCWIFTSNWFSRACHQYGGHYEKDHVDEHFYEISWGQNFHLYLVNKNGLWCMDMRLDPWYAVWFICYWDMAKINIYPVWENLSNFNIWGCSTYFLETRLHNPRKKILKGDCRSWRGINMGLSNMHSTQVGLAINFLTSSISPQYHVVFDDMLSTMVSTASIYT